MNDMELFANAMAKAMTVQQVADALNVSGRTVRRHAADMGLTTDGKITHLSEGDVTEIKKRIERSGRNDLDNVVQVGNATTDLEIAEMTLKVIAHHKAIADRLRAELSDAQPKIESFDALMRSELTMSITEASKHFGLHPKTETFPYLRAMGYLVRDDLPSQSAIDAGYLALRQNADRFGVCHAQAVVLTSQLEHWRAHVVHQVKRWCGEIK